MTRPAPFIAGTLAAILLLFGAYMGGYYAMLERALIIWGPDMPTIPQYRLDNTAVDGFFLPANQLDRLIRPDFWSND